MKLILYIPGKPEVQPRPRAAKIGQHIRIYSPTCPEHRALIRQIASEQFGEQPLFQSPLRVDCEFVFPRPGNMRWKTKPMPRVPHIKATGDLDNLYKAVLDALQDVIYVNDSIVFDGRLTKWIAAGDESPHTQIVITTTEDAE